LFLQITLIFSTMAQSSVHYMRPELLEEAMELKHRSYQSAVPGESFCTLRANTSRLLMPIHQLWSPAWCGRRTHRLVSTPAHHKASRRCASETNTTKTTRHLVFDICVEKYAVHGVMRQFGIYQPSLVLLTHTLSAVVHR
jgi:hypothetical protein